MQDKMYIYALRESTSEIVKYVGQTKNPKMRLCSHKSDAWMTNTKSKKAQWINSVMMGGGDIVMDILEECDPSLAEEREGYWIEHYTRKYNELTNGIGVPSETKYDGRIRLLGLNCTDDEWDELSSMLPSDTRRKFKIIMSLVSEYNKIQGT